MRYLFLYCLLISNVWAESGRSAIEQFDSVPVTQGNIAQWRTIYYVTLQNIKSGDAFLLHCEGQVRNDLGYNLELAQVIEIKEQSEGGTEPLNGIFISPGNGWNVNTQMHYGRFSKTDLYIAEKDYPFLIAACRVRFRSDAAKNNNFVIVNKGQGYMFFDRLAPQS
jgi:hypothetical protein